MIRRLLVLLLLLLVPAVSQMPEGMKTYWFVLLVKGPHRDQDEATAERIQAGHLANIKRLQEEGKLDLAGPFLDDGEWRGLFVLNVETEAEARALLETDPAIRSGRLRYELHSWLGQKGAQLR